MKLVFFDLESVGPARLKPYLFLGYFSAFIFAVLSIFFFSRMVIQNYIWKSIEARVVSNKINTYKHENEDMHQAIIDYTYTVGDNTYTGKYESLSSTTKSFAEDIVNDYPVGKEIQVKVNPKNYHSSTIIMRHDLYFWIAFFLIGIITSALFIKSVRYALNEHQSPNYAFISYGPQIMPIYLILIIFFFIVFGLIFWDFSKGVHSLYFLRTSAIVFLIPVIVFPLILSHVSRSYFSIHIKNNGVKGFGFTVPFLLGRYLMEWSEIENVIVRSLFGAELLQLSSNKSTGWLFLPLFINNRLGLKLNIISYCPAGNPLRLFMENKAIFKSNII